MKPFDFISATDVSDALGALARHEERARVISGGQSLLLDMKQRKVRPGLLVSISRIESLRGTSYDDDGELILGAATTYADLARSSLRGSHAMLPACAADIADIPVRNMGTVGGALCQAGHRFDFPTAALALDAQLVLESTRGKRTLAVDDFVLGEGQTAAEPDELLTAIQVARDGATGWAFEKFRFRKFDAALVSVACTLGVDDEGRVQEARLVVGAAAATPQRVAGAESALQGGEITEERAEEAAARAAEEVEPIDDAPYASRAYKTELVRTLVARSILRARARVEG